MSDIEILQFNDEENSEAANTNNPKLSILNLYGENLSHKKYITNPAIGREEEINKLILILLLPEKSAVIIGKPGIGKTALVEGLAFRMQMGNIPNALKDYQIIKINTTSLLGSTIIDGTAELKIQLLVNELKTKQNIILFIDEIHTLMGTGGNSGSLDFANMLKPGLDRGSIKIIGATTTEEFDRYIIRDRAFLRRFEKIELEEPSAETTIKILIGTIPKIEAQTGIKLDYTSFVIEKIITFMVNMTSEYKRVFELSSRYPDIALNLLTQAFSFALFDNSLKVTFKHIWSAIKNSKLVYPDVIIKEKKAFLEEFEEFLAEENVNVND
ncbi:MAG: AAA family ATPase [Bacilli bacterium]|jgi:ATP-dependent Clp protease ATP-binding subunit ClpA|nr:AAA family ATPase [Bacilli bacterium]